MANKKILVVTYYWFPYTGTGTYRISKFVKYLNRMGWDPVILTASKSASFQENKIEPEYKNLPVYRSKIWEPTSILKFFSGGQTSKGSIDPSIFYAQNRSWRERVAAWFRLNLFVPDAKIFWYPTAIKTGKKIIQKEHPKLILSTAPPPTAQLVARKLARWSGLPWLADFRDPWTNIYYYEDNQPNKLAEFINRKLEKSVISEADLLTVVNNGFFPEYDIQSKQIKIPNGFDRDDLKKISKSNTNKKFTIRYMGSMKLNQYPKNFITALRTISRDFPEIADRIRFECYGNIDKTIQKDLTHQDIKIDTSFYSFVSHEKAIELMANADLLLLVIGRSSGSKLVLSTKIFEYMMVNRPVLGIGHNDGAAADLVRTTGVGKFFDHYQKTGIAEYILETFASWKKGKLNIEPDENAIENYNFSKLTNKLEMQLKKIF